jgi:MFS family permease
MERITIVARRFLFTKGAGNGFITLFISKHLIQGAASALLGIFVPIFLYTTMGEQFVFVGGIYMVLSILYILLLAPGVKFMSRFGYRASLVLGACASVVVYTLLFFMDKTNVWTLIWFFVAVLVIYRIFHWVPYHVDFSTFTKRGERGRNVSLTFAILAFFGVAGPLLAGYIVNNSGYSALFGVAVILLIMAAVSYSFVPNVQQTYEWGYWKTWKELFSRERRMTVLGLFANGLENTFTLIAWPIFLYEVLNGNVFGIGLVSSLVVGVTILLQVVAGFYIDKKQQNKKRALRVGSTLYALGWVFKMFVLSISQIFFVGLYHNVAKIFTKTPFDTLVYDMTAEQGRYIDEFTVLREMAIHLGRVVGLVIIIGMTFYISIQWTFMVGAVAALLFNTIYQSAKYTRHV